MLTYYRKPQNHETTVMRWREGGKGKGEMGGFLEERGRATAKEGVGRRAGHQLGVAGARVGHKGEERIRHGRLGPRRSGRRRRTR